METLVQEKLKRKLEDKNSEVLNENDENTNAKAKSDADVSLLIKSIKSKTQVLEKVKNSNKFLKVKK